MGCIEKKKLSAYLDGELADEERARIKAHLEECAACRAGARELAAVTDALDALEELDPGPYFGARVKRLATGQRQHGRFSWIVVPAAATAATAFLVAGGLMGQALYAAWAGEHAGADAAAADYLYTAFAETYPEGSLAEFLNDFSTNGGNL